LNVTGDREVSSIGERTLDDVDGWLKHVRKSESERLVVVFVKNKDVGRVGVVGAKNQRNSYWKTTFFFTYFHYFCFLKQLVIVDSFDLLLSSYHFD
jgi:hypothetical protein